MHNKGDLVKRRQTLYPSSKISSRHQELRDLKEFHLYETWDVQATCFYCLCFPFAFVYVFVFAFAFVLKFVFVFVVLFCICLLYFRFAFALHSLLALRLPSLPPPALADPSFYGSFLKVFLWNIRQSQCKIHSICEIQLVETTTPPLWSQIRRFPHEHIASTTRTRTTTMTTTITMTTKMKMTTTMIMTMTTPPLWSQIRPLFCSMKTHCVKMVE